MQTGKTNYCIDKWQNTSISLYKSLDYSIFVFFWPNVDIFVQFKSYAKKHETDQPKHTHLKVVQGEKKKLLA